MKVIAIRRFGHMGKIYAKGKVFDLPDGQFSDWLDAGLVQQAPQKPKAVKKPAE